MLHSFKKKNNNNNLMLHVYWTLEDMKPRCMSEFLLTNSRKITLLKGGIQRAEVCHR